MSLYYFWSWSLLLLSLVVSLPVQVVLLVSLVSLPGALAFNPIPVTVLSGFLGAGKTTLLEHILHNNQGLRIGVVVNDLASVNIDARLLLANGLPDTQGDTTMIQLQNGCACCTQREELLRSISQMVSFSEMRRLSHGAPLDHIVVEMSGVADPRSVRTLFQEASAMQVPLMDQVTLDTMITVLDASSYETYLHSTKFAVDELIGDSVTGPPTPFTNKAAGVEQDGTSKGVADLLTSQTEVADIVILNKMDLIDTNPSSIQRVQNIIHQMNPGVRLIPTIYANVSLDHLLGAAGGEGVASTGLLDDHRDFLFHFDDHHHDPKTDTGHQQVPSTGATSRIGTFVYRARKPFHPERLFGFIHQLPLSSKCIDTHLASRSTESLSQTLLLLESKFPRLSHVLKQCLRSKGFVWFANSHQNCYYWSQSGKVLDLQCVGQWWATIPRQDWPEGVEDYILADFLGENMDSTGIGDRRQELVFIGEGYADVATQELLKDALDHCLSKNESESPPSC